MKKNVLEKILVISSASVLGVAFAGLTKSESLLTPFLVSFLAVTIYYVVVKRGK